MATKRSVLWSKEMCSPANLKERFCDQFPVIVMVARGYYGQTEIDTLGSDQVLILQGWSSQKRVVARDTRGRFISIPADYLLKFEVTSKTDQDLYLRPVSSRARPLWQILEQHGVPICVQFDRQVSSCFFVGSANSRYTETFGQLELVAVYDENYLKGNTINAGKIDTDAITVVPMYMKTHFVIAEGLKGTPPNLWANMRQHYINRVQHLDFEHVNGNMDIMLYDNQVAAGSTDYDLMMPKAYVRHPSIVNLGGRFSSEGTIKPAPRCEPKYYPLKTRTLSSSEPENSQTPSQQQQQIVRQQAQPEHAQQGLQEQQRQSQQQCPRESTYQRIQPQPPHPHPEQHPAQQHPTQQQHLSKQQHMAQQQHSAHQQQLAQQQHYAERQQHQAQHHQMLQHQMQQHQAQQHQGPQPYHQQTRHGSEYTCLTHARPRIEPQPSTSCPPGTYRPRANGQSSPQRGAATAIIIKGGLTTENQGELVQALRTLSVTRQARLSDSSTDSSTTSTNSTTSTTNSDQSSSSPAKVASPLPCPLHGSGPAVVHGAQPRPAPQHPRTHPHSESDSGKGSQYAPEDLASSDDSDDVFYNNNDEAARQYHRLANRLQPLRRNRSESDAPRIGSTHQNGRHPAGVRPNSTSAIPPPMDNVAYFTFPTVLPNKRFKSLDDIPEDVSGLSVEEVAECLRLLNLGVYVALFAAYRVDGDLLKTFTSHDLHKKFGISAGIAKKLERFAKHGWRPRLNVSPAALRLN